MGGLGEKKFVGMWKVRQVGKTANSIYTVMKCDSCHLG